MKLYKLAALPLVAALVALTPCAAQAQKPFPTAEAAADALVSALARTDSDALREVLGSDWKRYIPTADLDQDDVYGFLAAWAKSHNIVPSGNDQARLAVGTEGWILPIPIVKTGNGWRFDTRAATDELRTRRIGANELSAIKALLAYGDAQAEYAAQDRDGEGTLEYAQRIVSTPGKRDGLYWGVLPGEPESPLGPFFSGGVTGSTGYHGYHFRVLTSQGKDAKGGARNYIISGRMTGGFAGVAWPVRWGDTGVMTFIMNNDGVVYQKNLGSNSAAIARSIKTFNPDPTWEKIESPM